MATKAKTKTKAKPKPKAAKGKAKPAKPKAAKKSTTKTKTKAKAQKKSTTARERHRGRRPEPNPKVKARHLKAIERQRDKLVADEAKAAEARTKSEEMEQRIKDRVQLTKNELAQVIDSAQSDGVSTNEIAELIGKSRQTVFKLVAERVDGKKLNPSKAAQNGTRPSKPAKAKAAPKAKAKPAKTTKAKPPKKASVKPVAKKPPVRKAPAVVGRKADPAGVSKGKKRPPRKPKALPKAAAAA